MEGVESGTDVGVIAHNRVAQLVSMVICTCVVEIPLIDSAS